jgi:multidrug resistance efflux pump
MNQGIAFARTLRALDADDFRASRLWFLAAAILLGAWTWWLLAARLPQYESTNRVRIESGHAIAYFPADVLSHLHAGQRAVIHFDGSAFSARVQSIASDHAELDLAPNPQPPIPASSSASVDIETTRVSPAAIALQTLSRARR